MALIDELKEKLKRVEGGIDELHAKIREHGSHLETLDAMRWDLDTAIAALTPTPDFSAEKETAREQLEREPQIPKGWISWSGGDCPVDPDARVSVMFLDGETSHDGVIAGNMNWAHDASCAVRIYAYDVTEQASVQDETLDQGASEPVVRASPGEVEEIRDQFSDGWHDEAPALNEAMQDEREQGYAHVTNPEADAIARAHDYYSPEKVAERNRFNPFTMFRREPEGV
jgi:hypothetical protein